MAPAGCLCWNKLNYWWKPMPELFPIPKPAFSESRFLFYGSIRCTRAEIIYLPANHSTAPFHMHSAAPLPHLREEDKLQFNNEGYVKLPGLLPPVLLEKLRSCFETEMNNRADESGKVVFINKGREYVTNIDELCIKGNLACLELLGSPFILAIAEKICGPDYFLIQEFAVIKNRGDELPVLWHLDMLHQRMGNCFTMGIYLDDADANDGALRVIPGSHLDNREICSICKDPFIELPAKAGEILIHDMLLAHSSGLLQKNTMRRVIYFEFLTTEHVKAEAIYSETLVKRRMAVTEIARQYYQQIHSGTNTAEELEVIRQQKKKELAPLYKLPVQARPSTYCFEQPVI
jgi:ectoine hydroxylase-related dioxygenase (phytanoyl-CoA dioxygenase family)